MLGSSQSVSGSVKLEEGVTVSIHRTSFSRADQPCKSLHLCCTVRFIPARKDRDGATREFERKEGRPVPYR